MDVQVEQKFLSWSSFCVVVDGTNNTVSVYNEGSFAGSRILPHGVVPVPGGGSILLGQEVYPVTTEEEQGKGTSSQLSLMGELADVRLWDVVLSEADIQAVAKCEPVSVQPVVSFTPSDWLLNGTATWVTSAVVDNVCQLSFLKSHSRVFLRREHNREEATELCQTLGGRRPVLHSLTEEKLLKEAVATYAASADHGAPLVCLGANKTDSGWVDQYSGANLAYLDGLPIVDPLPDSDTSLCFHLRDDKWTEYYSNDITTVVCDIPVQKYTVRGLCKDSDLGREVWQHQTLSGQLIFREFGPSILTEGDSGRTWQLKHGVHNTTAVLPMRDTELPLGYATWRLWDRKCQYDGELQLPLLITSCPSQSFTCDDLTCIPQKKLCDLNVDCRDASDETHCSDTVLLPDDYKHTPPASIPNDPFTVECSVKIINYRKFDIKDMTVEVDLSITLRWQDPRLLYTNLKENEKTLFHSNEIEIWRPDLALFSALGAEAKLESVRTVAFVERSNSPLPDDLDNVYAGTS